MTIDTKPLRISCDIVLGYFFEISWFPSYFYLEIRYANALMLLNIHVSNRIFLGKQRRDNGYPVPNTNQKYPAFNFKLKGWDRHCSSFVNSPGRHSGKIGKISTTLAEDKVFLRISQNWGWNILKVFLFFSD